MSKHVPYEQHADLRGRFMLYHTVIHGAFFHEKGGSVAIRHDTVGYDVLHRIVRTATPDFTDATGGVDGRFLEFAEFGFEAARKELLDLMDSIDR